MRTLEQCEVDIRHGFAQAGRAFKEIRDNRLYQKSHGTFEDYCQKVWGFTRQRVNYYIQSSEVIDNLTTNCCQNLPTSEGVARELNGLSKEDQVEVWNKACETSSKPTAKEVAKIAAPKKSRPKLTEEQKEANRTARIEAKALEEQMRVAEIQGGQLLVWNKISNDLISELDDLIEQMLDCLEESEWLTFRMALAHYIEEYKRRNKV